MTEQNGNAKLTATWVTAAILVLAQALGFVIWITNMGAKVTNLEAEVSYERSELSRVDREGTRALSLVKDRQDIILRRIEALEALAHSK